MQNFKFLVHQSGDQLIIFSLWLVRIVLYPISAHARPVKYCNYKIWILIVLESSTDLQSVHEKPHFEFEFLREFEFRYIHDFRFADHFELKRKSNTRIYVVNWNNKKKEKQTNRPANEQKKQYLFHLNRCALERKGLSH